MVTALNMEMSKMEQRGAGECLYVMIQIVMIDTIIINDRWNDIYCRCLLLNGWVNVRYNVPVILTQNEITVIMTETAVVVTHQQHLLYL